MKKKLSASQAPAPEVPFRLRETFKDITARIECINFRKKTDTKGTFLKTETDVWRQEGIGELERAYNVWREGVTYRFDRKTHNVIMYYRGTQYHPPLNGAEE